MIDTTYIDRCISTLEKAIELLNDADKNDVSFDMYRSASIKEFEIVLELSGKLLKKLLKPYFHSPREVDRLYFKDIFRHAAHHGILPLEEAQRWIHYRDNRNTTSHDYGEEFADNTLNILPQFVEDARELSNHINRLNDDYQG